jgi:hypothetical protein
VRLDKHFRRLYKHAEEYRKAVSQRPAGSSRQRRQLRSCAHQVSRVAPPARPPLQARALTGNVAPVCSRPNPAGFRPRRRFQTHGGRLFRGAREVCGRALAWSAARAVTASSESRHSATGGDFGGGPSGSAAVGDNARLQRRREQRRREQRRREQRRRSTAYRQFSGKLPVSPFSDATLLPACCPRASLTRP